MNRLTHLFDGRLFEWAFSGGLLGLSIEVYVDPNTIRVGAFRGVLESFSPFTIASFSLVVSITSLVALWFNGRSLIVGPVVRSVCASCRAVIWLQLTMALYALSQAQGVSSLVFPLWVIIVMSEIYVSYRAMVDVRRYF